MGTYQEWERNCERWILSLVAHRWVWVYILIQEKDGTITEKYPGKKICYHQMKISVSQELQRWPEINQLIPENNTNISICFI